MRLTSLVAVTALPLAAARTANVRGSQEEQQSVHRAVKENNNNQSTQAQTTSTRNAWPGINPAAWFDPPRTVFPAASTTVSFQDYTTDGCGDALCGLCQGDCDGDDDCQGNLVCFQRTGDEAVAGCSGDAAPGWDYCYNPRGSGSAPAPPPAPAPAQATASRFQDYTADGCGSARCGQCEGDCDRDDDCQGNLVCFQRAGDEAVAGCRGTPRSGWDYCHDPNGSVLPPPPPPAPASGPSQWPGYSPNEWRAQPPPPPTPRPWYAPAAAPPTPRTPPSPSTCKEQSFRGEISPTNYHMAMLGQNNEVHQFFAEAAFPKGIDIDIDIRVMGIDRFDKVVDEELNFNFLGVDTDRDGPTPYEVPPSEDDVSFVEVIQSMPRCSEYRLEVRNLKYPFAFLEVYRVGGAASYYITFSYPNGCDFASRFVYVHDGWVRDVTGETPEVCLNF